MLNLLSWGHFPSWIISLRMFFSGKVLVVNSLCFYLSENVFHPHSWKTVSWLYYSTLILIFSAYFENIILLFQGFYSCCRKASNHSNPLQTICLFSVATLRVFSVFDVLQVHYIFRHGFLSFCFFFLTAVDFDGLPKLENFCLSTTRGT